MRVSQEYSQVVKEVPKFEISPTGFKPSKFQQKNQQVSINFKEKKGVNFEFETCRSYSHLNPELRRISLTAGGPPCRGMRSYLTLTALTVGRGWPRI